MNIVHATRIQDTPELAPEKSEHDNLSEVLTPHEGTYNLKDAANPDLREDREGHYAPAVLKMQLITEDYIGGIIELVNSASMNIFRNKGVTDRLKDDDEDKVVQKIGEIIIHTTVTNKVDGCKIIEAGENATIIDTVTMKGLQIGTSYTLKGYEMVKEENAKLLINGKEITGEYTFTADNEEMQVEIAFTFDARTLGGKNLVTFEELYETENPDTPVAEHKDINDKGQTVTVKASEDTPETPSISGPVKTGDNSPLLLYAILAGIAMLAAAGIGIYYYRRNN